MSGDATVDGDAEVVAIAVAGDAEEFVGRLVTAARAVPVDRVVVVLNGSRDATGREARDHGARVVAISEAVSEREALTVGLSVGGPASAYLCISGRRVSPAQYLAPFVAAVHTGADIAMADAGALLQQGVIPPRVAHGAYFLNCALGFRALESNACFVYPVCLSRRLVTLVGPTALQGTAATLLAARRAAFTVRALSGYGFDRTPFLIETPARAAVAETGAALESLIRALGPRGGLVDSVRRRSELKEQA